MKVNKNTINDYLKGIKSSEWSNQWIFHSIVESKYMFEAVSEDKKETIRRATELLEKELINFNPYNKEIWDILFPEWKAITSNMTIYLVVGCPNPYDAMDRVCPEGEEVIIFDINRMLNYVDKLEDLIAIIKNLLTHEYAHTCVHNDYQIIDASASFHDKLQYICFDEGFAHFLSFNESIRSINWLDNNMLEKKNNAFEQLKSALCSNENYEELLEEANAGTFWSKYGAISGLFGIADKFTESNNSNDSLLEIYKRGPEEFLLDIFSEF